MKAFEDWADRLVDVLDGSRLCLSEPVLELSEGLLDGIEIGAVGRQEEQLGACFTDGAAHGLSLVTAEIVEDDDVTRLKGWDQKLLDIGEELLAVDRAIEEAGGVDPVAAQGRQEGEFAPARDCPISCVSG